MCGVNIPVGDISMPTPLSLSVPENPIGMDVRKVPNIMKSNNKEKNTDRGRDILSTRLKDVRTCVNFLILLHIPLLSFFFRNSSLLMTV